MPTPTLLTPHRLKQLKREKKAYDRYQELINMPGAMPTAVEQAIMKEFGFANRSCVYLSNKRHEARLIDSLCTPAHDPTTSFAGTHPLDAASHTKATL